MVKYVFLSAVLMTVSNAYAQEADSIRFRNFPETKFFIKLPPGFREAPVIPAFEDAKKNSILLIPYTDSIEARRNGEASGNIAGKDSDIIFERITIGDFKGLLRISPEDRLMNHIAGFFTNGNIAFLILGSYDRSDSSLGASLVKSIKTIRYDKDFRYAPNPHTPFLLDDSQSPFKFSSSVMGMTYSYRPDAATAANDSVLFMVSLIPLVSGNEMDEMIRDLRIPLSNATMTEESYEPVNQFRAYTREFRAEREGKAAACFQRLVAMDRFGVLMEGIAFDEIDSNMRSFRALAATLKQHPVMQKK